MDNESNNSGLVTGQAPDDASLDLLIGAVSALLDIQRLRVVGILAGGPASRIDLSQATGLSHRELLRQLGVLQEFGLVRQEDLAVIEPDYNTRYVINEEAFRSARQALGKYKGRKPRPTDAREMTLETFMPAGKLASLPRKQSQLVTVLDEIARKFEPDRRYTEREVNVILEDVNEDYCTLRRCLVDFGYLSRSGGIYSKNA